MRPEISERWARAMAAIPTLDAIAVEKRAIANHLKSKGGYGADPTNLLWRMGVIADDEATALEAMVEYLRSLVSLTAEPVAERFATEAQADKYGASHMLLVRVPGMDLVTRKGRRRAAE